MSRLWRGLAPAVAATALLLAAAAPAAATPTRTAATSAAALPTCDSAVWAPLNVSRKRFLPMHSYILDCMLQRGDYNNLGVVALQEALITCYGQAITRDGDFGPDTETALKTVQAWEQYVKHKPIGVTGVYKLATMNAIMWPAYVDGRYQECSYDW